MTLLAWIGTIVLVLWLAGWLMFEVASGIVHLLLLVGLVLLILGLVRRGRTAVP
jgi:hypothetical protein